MTPRPTRPRTPSAEPPPLQLNPLEEERGFREMPGETPPPEEPEPVFAESAQEESAFEAEPEQTEPDPQPPSPDLQPQSGGPGRRKAPRGPAYAPTWFSFGLGGSPASFSIMAGVTHFVVPWVGIGLELRDDIIFDVANSFTATPVLTVLALPNRHVSPLLRGGMGLNVYSRGGAYAQFLAGAGLIFRFLDRYSVDMGVDLVGDIPRDVWFDNFECENGGDACWLGIRPSVGFGVSFGTP